MRPHALALLGLVACGCSGSDAADASPDANHLLLSQSGLYSNFATRTIATDYIEYTPASTLWADDLGKRRWVHLPVYGQIDKTDPDHWVFPVGTRFFKEFGVTSGPVLEIRLFEKLGPGSWHWGSYVMRADGSDGDWTESGATNVLGTDHDVPSSSQCAQCHNGEADMILGYSAIQQATLPWDATTNAALGYLHANCGHCHNPLGSAWGATKQLLRLSMADLQVLNPRQTGVGTNIVGVATDRWMTGTGMFRVAPHDLAHSAIYLRMMARSSSDQMPPIATKHADTTGIAAVQTWIGGL